ACIGVLRQRPDGQCPAWSRSQKEKRIESVDFPGAVRFIPGSNESWRRFFMPHMEVHWPATDNRANFTCDVPAPIEVANALRRGKIREDIRKVVVVSHHLPDAFGRSAHDDCGADLFSPFGSSNKLGHYAVRSRGWIACLWLGPIAS